jgi:hypothetical protein
VVLPSGAIGDRDRRRRRDYIFGRAFASFRFGMLGPLRKFRTSSRLILAHEIGAFFFFASV